jgi:hypothetical protein
MAIKGVWVNNLLAGGGFTGQAGAGPGLLAAAAPLASSSRLALPICRAAAVPQDGVQEGVPSGVEGVHGGACCYVIGRRRRRRRRWTQRVLNNSAIINVASSRSRAWRCL